MKPTPSLVPRLAAPFSQARQAAHLFAPRYGVAQLQAASEQHLQTMLMEQSRSHVSQIFVHTAHRPAQIWPDGYTYPTPTAILLI